MAENLDGCDLRESHDSLLRQRLHSEEGDDISGDAFRDERLRMNREIEAAEQSLAETELRLTIETAQLKMALELAQNVGAVYAKADEATQRRLNHAFFKQLYVTPEWDEVHEQTTAFITEAELTEPYTLPLAKDFAVEVLTEAEDITAASAENAKSAPESRSDFPEAPSGPVFILRSNGGLRGTKLEHVPSPGSTLKSCITTGSDRRSSPHAVPHGAL